MPYATTGDVQLFYTEHGTGAGAPLLLVHGWACDSHDWSWQIPALAANRRVLVPDLRAHGRSGDPGRGYAPTDFAEDLIALLDARRIDRAVVVGHSMGAIIASVLTASHPNRVAGIGVIDPPYGFDSAAAAANLEFAETIDTDNAVELAAARLAAAEGPQTPQWLSTWHQRRVAGVSPAVLAGAVEAVHGSLGSVANQPQTDALLRSRRVPVFAAHVDPQRAAWELALSAHPASRSIAFEGSGHWVHQERPEAFNAALLAWLAEIA